MNSFTKHIGLAALASITTLGAVLATQGSASAAKDQMYFCDMTGWWDGKDDFKFLAEYLAKDGPDYFRGLYENPGQATAEIIGRATNNTWEIIFTYTDAGHKGMSKKAIGKGFRDGGKNEITVEGLYKTYIGASDIKKDGTFKLHGRCRKTK